MIPAVAQTLAKLLTNGTSLDSEQIDFSHPSTRQDQRPALNLYFYHVERHQPFGSSWGYREAHCVPEDSATWFDVSFLLIAWGHTAIAEHRLLSEALILLSQYCSLPEESLAPSLQGYGALPMHLLSPNLTDTATLWKALGVPLRPALQVTITVPFHCIREPSGKFSPPYSLATPVGKPDSQRPQFSNP
jgi:Pvc16 N-terminal domain